MEIREELFSLRDEGYAAFQARLIPNIPADSVIGVRIPMLRRLAKKLAGTERAERFLRELPHAYYDENLLHGLLIAELKDYSACVSALERFLPFVDNWAVCDTVAPKVFGTHKPELSAKIREWIVSPHVYTCRFAVGMLLRHFLEEDFREEYPAMVAAVPDREYYVSMMVAWYFATALAKQWDAVLPYVRERRLSPETHSRTIRKAQESFRITPEQKALLKTMK